MSSPSVSHSSDSWTSRAGPTAPMAASISRSAGRHELGAVVEVDLVAVVVGRVVAGRHHDPDRAPEVADGEGEHRRRQLLRQHLDGEPRAGEHLRGDAGELVGAAARVVADDHPGAGVPGVGEPAAQPRGGPGDHGGVHPGRPGAEGTAQPRRPEGERAGEAPLQFRAVAGGDQRLDLGPVARVRVGVRPCPGGFEDVHSRAPAASTASASNSASVYSPPTRRSTGSVGSGSPMASISASA